MKSNFFPSSGKWFSKSKKSSKSKCFDQFPSSYCSRADWVFLPCRNRLLCLLIWLWYSPRSSRSIFDDCCLIFDFLSVRIIRTESLRRILAEDHHYPFTNAITTVAGPVLARTLQFQGNTAPQHVILDPQNCLSCQMQRLVENLNLNNWDSYGKVVWGAWEVWIWSVSLFSCKNIIG